MIDQDQSRQQKKEMVILTIVFGALFCICILILGTVLLVYTRSFNAYSADPNFLVPATPTPVSCPPVPSNWDVKIEDRFNNHLNEWPFGNTDDEYVTENQKIIDGKYRIHAVAKKSVNTYFYPSMDYKVYDFYLSADARQLEGQLDNMYGLMYRLNPDRDRYFFGIRETQRFTLRQYLMNEWHTLIPPTYSPAIMPGEANRLVVVANGSSFTFCINQALVAEIENADITSGKAGFSYSLFNEGDEATFEFDNFQLYVPPETE